MAMIKIAKKPRQNNISTYLFYCHTNLLLVGFPLLGVEGQILLGFLHIQILAHNKGFVELICRIIPTTY